MELHKIRIDSFKKFLESETLSDTLTKYNNMLNLFDLEASIFENFYFNLKKSMHDDIYTKSFFDDLTRKINNKIYSPTKNKRTYLRDQNCLIIGGGPCGLRLAIELQLLGARVLIVEKRDSNTVNSQYLHLWPFVVADIRMLACKFIHPKFDFTETDYIQVKKLELILLKVALILGCEYENNVEFCSLCPMSLKKDDKNDSSLSLKSNEISKEELSTKIRQEKSKKSQINIIDKKDESPIMSLIKDEKNDKKDESPIMSLIKDEKSDSPQDEQPSKLDSLETEQKSNDCCCSKHLDPKNQNHIGAYAHFNFHHVNQNSIDKMNKFCFNIIVDAGGKTTILGNSFTKKKSQSKLEIVIACNFVRDKRKAKGARLASLLSSVNQQSHPHLFQILFEITGVDLVNYCLYRGDSFFFVMIPKKQSLINKGVLIEDKKDPKELFLPENICKKQLFNYAKSAGIFLTGLELEFAMNSDGETDCKIFNFTSSSSSKDSCCVKNIYSRIKCCKNPDNQIRPGTLFIGLCGDSLIDSFWPIGSTPGRGFLSVLDIAWICRQFGSNRLSTFSVEENEPDLLQLIAEREMIYEFLPCITGTNIIQNFTEYTIDPSTRYLNYSVQKLKTDKYRHLLNPKLAIRKASGQTIHL